MNQPHLIFWKLCVLMAATSCLSLGPLQKFNYLLDQVWMGTRILWSSKNIHDVFDDPDLNERYGAKLRHIISIKEFAQDYGLTTDSSYESMVFPPNNQEVVSYLVVAAKPLSLQALSYSFPFVGRVPYLGFFDESDRNNYAANLKEQGYDIHLSQAGAFSLLGYLKDPIFPSMLTGNISQLAHLFFHELTHATVWKKNQASFNEHLAEFISITLTLEYLKSHNHVELYTKFQNLHHDLKLFHDWISQLKEELNLLFADTTLSDDEKLKRKSEIYNTAGKNSPPFRSHNFIGDITRWNNARLALKDTYSFRSDIFIAAYSCFKSDTLKEQTRAFLTTIQEKDFEDGQSKEDYLKSLCHESL
ncbi:MAG: aminopeptidase [Proteobacteria bacterium]|nr:aminopeptidase [Pseudomonadota bacterium]